MTKATNELQSLLAVARGLLESEALPARINDMQGSADAVIDHIAWRLIQLVAVIGLVALAFRLASARLRKTSAR